MRTELRGEKLEIRNSLVHNLLISYLIYFLTFISITTVTMFLYSMCSTKPLFRHPSQILMFLDKKQWKVVFVFKRYGFIISYSLQNWAKRR